MKWWKDCGRTPKANQGLGGLGRQLRAQAHASKPSYKGVGQIREKEGSLVFYDHNRRLGSMKYGVAKVKGRDGQRRTPNALLWPLH